MTWRPPHPAAVLEQVRALTVAGKSSKLIGIELGIPWRTVKMLRSRHGWKAAPGTPSIGLAHPLAGGGIVLRSRSSMHVPHFSGRKAVPEPKRVTDTDAHPVPVDVPRWQDRDIWCRRANACLALAEKWPAMSCERCPVRGRDQEDNAERLAGLALLQAYGPEVGTGDRE